MNSVFPLRRVALVTGGSRGIGRAIVEQLAASHHAVAFSYRSDEASACTLVEKVAARGGQAIAFRADNMETGAIDDLVSNTERELGEVDVLVCNAGIGPHVPVDSITLQDWQLVMQANLESAFVASQRVIKGMQSRRWGRIIYLSSIASKTGGVVSAAYAASKAGLEGLMHYYAAQLGTSGITANAVAPAFIATDMLAGLPMPPLSVMPLGRLGDPQEVASAIGLLVDNGFITGQTLHVSAGRFMT
jgi:3-oxoacyl-[acyl-carrier protein] reductase